MDSADLKNLTVRQVANKFKVNVCFLSRKFKENNNMLLSDYIDFVKITHAIHLVKHGDDMELEEISKLIGIKKKKTFREKFKKIYGISPYKLRQIIQKVHKN